MYIQQEIQSKANQAQQEMKQQANIGESNARAARLPHNHKTGEGKLSVNNQGFYPQVSQLTHDEARIAPDAKFASDRDRPLTLPSTTREQVDSSFGD